MWNSQNQCPRNWVGIHCLTSRGQRIVQPVSLSTCSDHATPNKSIMCSIIWNFARQQLFMLKSLFFNLLKIIGRYLMLIYRCKLGDFPVQHADGIKFFNVFLMKMIRDLQDITPLIWKIKYNKKYLIKKMILKKN